MTYFVLIALAVFLMVLGLVMVASAIVSWGIILLGLGFVLMIFTALYAPKPPRRGPRIR